MDDKRTLLAFLAIGAILLLLPYYYDWAGLSRPARPPEVPAGEAPPPASPAAPAAVTPSLVPPTGAANPDTGTPPQLLPAVEPAPAWQEREVVVETPLQRLTFSTRGGALVSCQLLEYLRVDGAPVELLPPRGRGILLGVRGPGASELDFSELGFEPSREHLRVGAGEEAELSFRADAGGGVILEKKMRFRGDRYGFGLEVGYRGLQADTELLVSWEGGVAITEGQAGVDLGEARVVALFNGAVEKVKVDGDDREETFDDKGLVQWAGARSKYFLTAVAPTAPAERTAVRLTGAGRGKGELPAYRFALGTRAGRDGAWAGLVYAGPLEYDELARYQLEFERAIDFGWPVVKQITWFLLVVFKATYKTVPNYGWIIVIFAVAIKLVLYPLTAKTYESGAKMQQLQPKIAALREKYRNDQQRLSRETMRLYKEEGVNPLGGCLPMLLQMPIFFALYNLFGRTIELRQAPFIGWIHDLSIPDGLRLAGMEVRVLPILMGVSMLVQQKMTIKDPKQALLVYLMPVMMIFIFWGMSSGLVLYWTVFNVLSIGQQVIAEQYKRARDARTA